MCIRDRWYQRRVHGEITYIPMRNSRMKSFSHFVFVASLIFLLSAVAVEALKRKQSGTLLEVGAQVDPSPHYREGLKGDITCNRQGNYIIANYKGSCQAYVVCKAGSGRVAKCPMGYVFHPGKRDCVKDTEMGCVPTEVVLREPQSERVDNSQSKDVPQHNTLCNPTGANVIPWYEQDCRKWAECDASRGVAVVRKCTGSYYYNPNNRKCDIPERAHCPYFRKGYNDNVRIPYGKNRYYEINRHKREQQTQIMHA
eukprot:TRINITY_DN2159_c0_g1_i2.p1 TRINITY_DN2159_c0_g1~~TRINITY_DN2159_c0_g1_i2.p1  ORF type:complete len:255 (+),score=34.11 TRINITY_DN2159_c0_g1_i2:78-842(+)